jgi:arabinogalactan oligomer / maltooligosaccharide transport system substrate-binding protein
MEKRFRMKEKIHNISLVLLVTTVLFCIFSAISCGETSGPGFDLTLWSGLSPEETGVIKQAADNYRKTTGRNISVVHVPFSEILIKYKHLASSEQGPDLVIGPQDWIGELASKNLVAQLEEADFTDEQKILYNPSGLECVMYNGKIYAIPLVVETIALIYNEELVETIPVSLEDIIRDGISFQKSGRDKYGFFFDVNNLYYSWPFFSAFGSSVFDINNGRIDTGKVLLDSPEMVQGMKYLARLKQEYDLIPPNVSTYMMNEVFLSGNMPYCLNGPWILNDLNRQGIKYRVIPIPPMEDGRNLKPFVGVKGIMLNRYASNRTHAVRFMHYLANPENQRTLCTVCNNIPSRFDADTLLIDRPDLRQFFRASLGGVPIPNHPSVNTIWRPMRAALFSCVFEGEMPEKVLPVQVKKVRDRIANTDF